MEMKRIRIHFIEDEKNKILKKSQRRKGLNLSWIQIKPNHRTVSDISAYIIDIFRLHHSCPYGIILTMDGFVLPPFESASILMDNDIIGVKRKSKSGDKVKNLIEDDKIVENQALSLPLLTNEEFEKESVGYSSESDEAEKEHLEIDNQTGDGVYEEKSPDRNKFCKKRKASKNLKSSKKKKKKKSLPSDQMQAVMILNADKNATLVFHPSETSGTKKNVSKIKKKKPERASTFVSVESNDDSSQSLPGPNRCSPIQEMDMGCGVSSEVPEGTEKKPSRSARRKKAKRQWRKEIEKAEKEQLLLSNGTCSRLGTNDVELKKTQSLEIGVNEQSVKHHLQNQNGEADNEIALDVNPVPIVIRPGHIHFEPLEEDATEERIQQRHVSSGVQWNGITNKKKGQKWGTEKSTSWRNEFQGFNNEISETMAVETVKTPNDTVNFDNLAPLRRLPKEGDLIAYRLVELSSTWTPELTSFRVGKTSWYDSTSNKILLTPLPEYPVTIETVNEEDTFGPPPSNDLYKEDGSLEVDFSSLVDVRMVKESDLGPAKTTSDRANVLFKSNVAHSSTTTRGENDIHESTVHSEKQENAWDEFGEAINAKKAELEQENSWMKENSDKGGRSFSKTRGSAMGPIMARLRANNEI